MGDKKLELRKIDESIYQLVAIDESYFDGEDRDISQICPVQTFVITDEGVHTIEAIFNGWNWGAGNEKEFPLSKLLTKTVSIRNVSRIENTFIECSREDAMKKIKREGMLTWI